MPNNANIARMRIKNTSPTIALVSRPFAALSLSGLSPAEAICTPAITIMSTKTALNIPTSKLTVPAMTELMFASAGQRPAGKKLQLVEPSKASAVAFAAVVGSSA